MRWPQSCQLRLFTARDFINDGELRRSRAELVHLGSITLRAGPYGLDSVLRSTVNELLRRCICAEIYLRNGCSVNLDRTPSRRSRRYQ